jgi:hypothetical protein
MFSIANSVCDRSFRIQKICASAVLSLALISTGTAFSADNSFSADSELVSTDAASLLELEGSLTPQDESYLGVKDFLTCFVSNLDLPTQVYLDCGIAVVQSAMNCREGFLNFQCISSVVRVANKCALPLSRAAEGAKVCWAAQNPGL